MPTIAVSGCATLTSFAGHAPASAKANTKLTFRLDHSVGPITVQAQLA